MVADYVIQREINKKEYKYHPFRLRPFHPNFSVKPLCGKFYARHDFPDPRLLDESLKQAILKLQKVLSKDKYPEPQTTNMEYGWYLQPQVIRPRFNFRYPKCSSWVTQIGLLIAMENQQNPRKIRTITIEGHR